MHRMRSIAEEVVIGLAQAEINHPAEYSPFRAVAAQALYNAAVLYLGGILEGCVDPEHEADRASAAGEDPRYATGVEEIMEEAEHRLALLARGGRQ